MNTHRCDPPHNVNDSCPRRWTCPHRYCGRVWHLIGTRTLVPASAHFDAIESPIWRRPGFKERVRTFKAARLVPVAADMAAFFILYSLVFLAALALFGSMSQVTLALALSIFTGALVGGFLKDAIVPDFNRKDLQ